MLKPLFTTCNSYYLVYFKITQTLSSNFLNFNDLLWCVHYWATISLSDLSINWSTHRCYKASTAHQKVKVTITFHYAGANLHFSWSRFVLQNLHLVLRHALRPCCGVKVNRFPYQSLPVVPGLLNDSESSLKWFICYFDIERAYCLQTLQYVWEISCTYY